MINSYQVNDISAKLNISQMLLFIKLFLFISGTSASDVHFQAYLLDGLMRWNADRASAGVIHQLMLFSSMKDLVQLLVCLGSLSC